MLQPAQTPPSADRSGMLDALRFLAAAFIVLYHFGSEAPVPLEDLSPLLARGWLATDFFLILSGYVLGRAYGQALDDRRLGWSGFFARRLARVWPAQLMILGALALLVGAAALVGVSPGSPEHFGVREFFSQAALIQAWGLPGHEGWNEPSWSLSALIVCYAVFPAVWLASRPLRGRTAALVAGLSVLIAGAAFSLAALGLSLYDLPFHLGLARALPLFVLGLFMASFMSGRTRTRAFSVASLISALGALITLQAAEPSELTSFASVVAIGVIVISADGLRLRTRPWLKGGADLAFALFISHALTGAAFFSAAEALGLSHSWPMWALSLPLALLVAWAFHRFLDAPLQRRIRVLLDRPATAGAPTSSQPA